VLFLHLILELYRDDFPPINKRGIEFPSYNWIPFVVLKLYISISLNPEVDVIVFLTKGVLGVLSGIDAVLPDLQWKSILYILEVS
jgi:hypothetical protein